MATYDKIKEVLGIPKTTLADWKNTKDYRVILFGAFRNMSPDELEGFVLKSNNRKEKMEYIIVKSDPCSDTLSSFEKKVEKYLNNGWKLSGGVTVVSGMDCGGKNKETQLLQAVYKSK